MIGGGIKLSDGRTISSDTVNTIAGGASVPELATYSSYIQMTSLTTDQIAALVAQIDGLISTQNHTIIDTQSQITSLQASIDNPVTGYQYIYNSTIAAYSSAVIQYLTQEAKVDATAIRLSSLQSTLSTVLVEEAQDISTMEGYSKEYSTFLLKIQANDNALNSELASYESLSTTMGSYVNEYAMTLAALQVEIDPVRMSTLSTTMGNDLIQESLIGAYLQSTLNTLSSMEFMSTQYQSDINDFTSTNGAYSALKNGIFSTIEQLMAEEAAIVSSITDYDNQLWYLSQSTNAEFALLGQNMATFYTGKLTQIQNQVLQVQYSVKEWESYIGYMISQFMIQKLQLYTKIDLLSFQISQSSDPGTKSGLSSQRDAFSANQTTMQTIIANLTPLTLTFSNIYTNISGDLQLRSDFISTQQQMTTIEINVFKDDTVKEENRQTYLGLQNTLGQKVIGINAARNARQRMIQSDSNSVMAVFNGQWSAINSDAMKQYITFTRPAAILSEIVPFYLDPTEFQITPPLVYV